MSEHERHTEEVTFRLSARLVRALEQLAHDEETSTSEIIREALAVRWGLTALVPGDEDGPGE